MDLLQAFVQSAEVDPGEVVGSVSLLRHDQGQLRRQDATGRYLVISVMLLGIDFQPPHHSDRRHGSLLSSHLVLAVRSGLLVVDGEEQHMSEFQIWRVMKRWKLYF